MTHYQRRCLHFGCGEPLHGRLEDAVAAENTQGEAPAMTADETPTKTPDKTLAKAKAGGKAVADKRGSEK